MGGKMNIQSFLSRISALLAISLVAGCSNKSALSDEQAQKVAALQTQIAQLSVAADRVQDTSDIKRLQRAYGYYLDKADWDNVADLFADDGSIEIAQHGVYIGKEHIRKYLYSLGNGKAGLQQGQLNEHMQLQPVVDVSDDGLTAKARWRAFIMAGQYGKSATWGEGPYENEYVKDNGVWKIKKLHWYRTFVVPYEGGWAKNKDVAAGEDPISKELPPDQPPTEKYGLWPDVYIPPYHYKNPVTGVDRSAGRK